MKIAFTLAKFQKTQLPENVKKESKIDQVLKGKVMDEIAKRLDR